LRAFVLAGRIGHCDSPFRGSHEYSIWSLQRPQAQAMTKRR
jgi:hypothetical protein